MIQEVAVKVPDLIRNPPDHNLYQTLKDQLLRMVALNDYARAEAIANILLIGNIQPSTLMSRMLSLFPDGHKPCFFRRTAMNYVFLPRSCSLLLFGKLAGRQEDMFSLPASAPESSLIYLQDLLS